MGTGELFSHNWFDILSAVLGICGLWAAVFTIHKDTRARREETKARKISNLLAITANHREVWKEYFMTPKLARIMDLSANVDKEPVTPAELFFVSAVIAHTSSVYEALKDELIIKQEGLRRDVGQFFSLPIPRAVWSQTRLLQNLDFAAFVESSLKQP